MAQPTRGAEQEDIQESPEVMPGTAEAEAEAERIQIAVGQLVDLEGMVSSLANQGEQQAHGALEAVVHWIV